MTDAPPIPPLLLTARQAAAALAISEATLFRRVRDGTIPAVHLGACLRFSPADLATVIDRLKAEAVAEVSGVCP